MMEEGGAGALAGGGEKDTASTRSLSGSHFGAHHDSSSTELNVSIAEYDRKAASKESFFQDVHVEYLIISTSHDKASGSVTKRQVWHRYRDFELLRDYLVTIYPSLIVPPIAEKKVNLSWEAMGVDRFEAAFLDERLNALEVFLERITSHPILAQDRMIHLFLSEDADFRTEVVATNFQEKSDSRVKAVAALLRLKKSDKRFMDMKHYADTLEMSVHSILANHRALLDQQRAIYSLHSVYGRILSEWSGVEADLCDELQLSGGHVDSLADAMSGFSEEEETKFSQPMKEYALYGEGLRSVARHQMLLQYDLEQMEESLSVKAMSKSFIAHEPEDQMTFGRLAAKLLSGDGSKEARLQTVQREIDDLEGSSQKQVERLNTFTSSAMHELTRFQHQRDGDIRAFWIAYSKLQIRFLKKALSSWQNIQKSFK